MNASTTRQFRGLHPDAWTGRGQTPSRQRPIKVTRSRLMMSGHRTGPASTALAPSTRCKGPSSCPIQPPGSWNTYLIEANGSQMNGTLVNSFTSKRQASGYPRPPDARLSESHTVSEPTSQEVAVSSETTVANTFPFTGNDLGEGERVLYGINSGSGSPVLLDRFRLISVSSGQASTMVNCVSRNASTSVAQPFRCREGDGPVLPHMPGRVPAGSPGSASQVARGDQVVTSLGYHLFAARGISFVFENLVGGPGFEPGTSRSRTVQWASPAVSAITRRTLPNRARYQVHRSGALVHDTISIWRC
jgi:hypothetical protein